MTKLISLFFVALTGIGLRWAILGEYDSSQLQLTFIFLGAAPLFLWISIRQKHKDADYSPLPSSRQWTTSLKDKWLTGEKKIFQGEELVATYNRVYNKSFHKIIADLMRTPGLWFLQLAFQFKDGRTFTVTSEENWKGNARYTIWEGNTEVATIRSDLKSEHVKKLLEHTVLEIGEHVYEFRARTVRSRIEVLKDGELIGEVERDLTGVRSLSLNSSEVNVEDEPFLLMGWIVFSYRYNK
ncbi:tubby C-terminal domain-like protein [Alkalihalobacterium chitinilyticum]|uniref:Tubby C-terminal domain-containing protein n=1 Tax=Alkalihalobacterium chitinilyticum TaxID=2980103 RepID=A0ABT5VL08_9BACI|nr:hypothetical protein [Alkalihalobacterium chitinilyticum]MDE5416137.1 hypothetical protein [Alkalihalobacterium chitinilyticum]